MPFAAGHALSRSILLNSASGRDSLNHTPQTFSLPANCVSVQTASADNTTAMHIQAWEDIGGRDFFFTTKCHQLLRDHSKEVSGTGLPNLLGDRVFKLVYTQGKVKSVCIRILCSVMSNTFSGLLPHLAVSK